MKINTKLFWTPNKILLSCYLIFLAFLIAVLVFFLPTKKQMIFAPILVVSYFLLILVLYTLKKVYIKNIKDIQDSLDFYSTKVIKNIGVGIIVFNSNKNIIWTSDLINERFNTDLLGKSILELHEKMDQLINVPNIKNITIELNNLFYKVQIIYSKKVILIQDITINHLTNQYYKDEKIAIGLVDIDSYVQYQTLLEDEELFKVDTYVIKVLDTITTKYNLIYLKYSVGRFLIIANQKSLRQMENIKFDFLNILKNHSKKIGIKISLSIGFGVGSSKYHIVYENARAALIQSQSRGGDQVTVYSDKKGSKHYGALSEAIVTKSRVKIKAIANALLFSLLSKDIENMIILGHKNGDLDAIGAALGLVSIAKANNKPVYIANVGYDSTTRKAIDRWLLSEKVELFIRTSKAKKIASSKTLVVIVDTSNKDNIESYEILKKIKKENIYLFDHHRVNPKNMVDIKKENLYADTTSSSTCEIVAELMRFLNIKKEFPIRYAQFMLAGIYLDTNHFQKTTSFKTYDSASWLEQQGANPNEAADILKINEHELKAILAIEKNTQEIKPGYVLSVYEGELESHIIAKAAEQLLRISGRKASFVIAKEPKSNYYRMSARSNDVNVQTIAELVGGGGHFLAAAAMSNEPLEIFRDNLIQAIVSME